MKNIKNIFIFFLLVVTLSFSIESKESIVYLEKENEISKLKIGVTKLKSESLPISINMNSKKIYGEIAVDDNDLVYVSETLAEIPSVSTTNGRRSINNIKKYLTKEIKKAPNFEYKIVKDERDKENPVKYLIIDYKKELKSVYVYIVEKDTYKVKKVYRGSFIQLFSTTASEVYGDISISEEVIDHEYRKITLINNDIFVSTPGVGSYNTEDIEAKGKVKLTGKFPERASYDKIKEVSGRKDPWVVVTISSKNDKSVKALEIKLNRSDKGFGDFQAIANLKDSTRQDSAQININSGDYYNKENYLSIFLRRVRPFEDDEYKIELKYGYYWLGSFYEVINHKFTINIKGNGEQLLSPDTEGKIIFDKPEPFLSIPSTIIGGSVSGETPNVENQNIQKEEYRSVGKFLKKPLKEKLNVNAIEDGIDLHMILNTSTISGFDKKYEKTITLKGTKLWDGKISEVSFTSDLFDVVGKKIGTIGLYSDNENEDYYKIKITGWDSTFTHQLVNTKITLIYEKVTKRGSKEETRKPIKKDIYSVLVNPKPEIIPPDTRGTFIITNPSELVGHDIYITEARKIGIRTNSEHKNGSGSTPTFKEEQILFSGEIPKKFITNKDSGNWVNWGEKSRLIIRGDNGFGDASTNYNYNDGTFNTTNGNKGWYYIHSNKNKEIGWIYFSSALRDTNTNTLVVGFAGKGIGGSQIKLADNESVNHRFEFVYQVQIGNEWIDKKVDVLDLIIQPNLPAPTPTIELKNPLVYYDYSSSSAISNIVHNRRAHLSKNEAITLNNNGSRFTKNTSLIGEDWIIANADIRDYPWKTLGKHKISINRGKNEVIKITKENGGTNSSTYLSGDKIGDVNGNKNEVMLSYDGGNKYLNFGLSKYNFDGEDINDISITNYTDKAIESRVTYKVKIPKFDGIHYMSNNYDIKPKRNYIKNYAYDSTKSNDEEIIIEYGRVGFRDLDTRITTQSGGEGIDFRVTKKVKLVHLNKNNQETGYVINNAELYFENNIDVSDDNDSGTSRFKGKNEKATSAMLKLKIPVQELLIKEGKYKILTNDENKIKNANPLRIGVTVNNNKEKYYTYMGGESFENGNIGNTFTTGTGKNLYLNITTKRFVETIIEFENENLKKEKGNINWIKLNKSDYSFGKLTNKITLVDGKQSDIWGRVRGEIIDIPVNVENSQNKRNLKMTLFDDNNNILIDNLNTIRGEYKFALTSNSNNNPRNFLIGRENINDSYIRFSLDNGYDATKEKDIKFYIRYIDTSNGKNKFLFDQRYIVKFKQTINYKGDINIRFKNPSMTMDNDIKSGAINLYTKKYNNDSNHSTTKDKIDWVELQISDETIDNLKIDSQNSSCELYDNLNKVLLTDLQMKEFVEYQNNKFIIGLPKTINIFTTLFGKDIKNKIEKTFEMRFKSSVTGVIDDGKNKTYRLNITIDEFDPKYYGKVFVGNGTDRNEDTYEEINSVGDGNIDLMRNDNVVGDYVYINLETSYRDYLRYEALPKALLNENLFIKVKGQVEAIPVNSDYAKSVKGEIVLANNTDYIDITNDKKIIEFTKDRNPTANHKNYPLKLKLSLTEYKKLKPHTKYEISLNGNQNIITIGTDTLNDNILFNKPLNFTTTGPGIKIETSILDFGKINLEQEIDSLIIKNGKTETPIKVTMSGAFDTNLGIKNQELIVNTDTIFIKQRGINSEVIANGGELKVRDLKTEKLNGTPIKITQGSTEVVEYYDVSGILEVPKNLPRNNYGIYMGIVEVTYTFY